MDDHLDSSRCARLMKALSEPARLRMVECLQSGPKSVSDIALLLEIDVPNASHHLRTMFNAGLVTTQREGKYIYYSLAPEVFHGQPSRKGGVLDFGCCRIELGDQPRRP